MAALATIALTVVLAACGGSEPDPTAVFDTVHGTRPTELDAADVARLARAFGISGEPERVRDGPSTGGWEAEDELRALYLTRTPSAWYAQVTDSSAITHPEGDRAAICAAADAPSGCASPDVRFVVDVGLDAPGADRAIAAARTILDAAGITDDRWTAITSGPSREPIPCREPAPNGLDCTRQLLPTRGVTLELELGDGRTPVRWGLVVGPNGGVLSATGRIAAARGASTP
jgi:hypothetical protein